MNDNRHDEFAGLTKYGLIKHPESLRDTIVRFIETKIISGDMEAGKRLLPDELAGSLNVSKSPVREALLSLQKEGLVTNVPRVGFFVTKISIEDIEEIYPIRAALLSLMVKTVIETGFDLKFIRIIDSQIEKMRESVNGSDLKGYHDHNLNFHNTLLEYCGNTRLRSIISQLGKQVLRMRMLSLSGPGRMKRSLELNEKLVQAIKKKDIEASTNLSTIITQEGLENLRKVLSKNNSTRMSVNGN